MSCGKPIFIVRDDRFFSFVPLKVVESEADDYEHVGGMMLLRAQLPAIESAELEELSPRARSVYERLAKGTFEFDLNQVADAISEQDALIVDSTEAEITGQREPLAPVGDVIRHIA